MAQSAKAAGRDVASGARPVYALALIAGAVVVLREGSETVLFVYSVAVTAGGAVWELASAH